MEDLVWVLVVDDDDVDRMAVRRGLKVAGLSLSIEEAHDGATAIALVQARPFDCVFLDYRLPDSDGLAILRQLRIAGVKTPVVMLTGQGDEQLAVELMKAGATDYLPKSKMSPESLSLSLRNALRLHRAELQTAEAEAQRWRAEQALHASEQLLATTLRSIGDAVIATDPQGQITFMNAVAEVMTGWILEEALGRPLTAVFHIVNEETRAEVESPVTRTLREGAVIGLANHTLLIARDGRELPIDDSGAPIRNAEGKIIGAVMVFHDISERKQAEVALRQSEGRFRRLFESNVVGIIFANITGTIVDANDAFLQLVGYTRADMLDGQVNWVAMTPPEHKPKDDQALAEIKAGGTSAPFEKEYLHKTGRRVPVVLAGAQLEGSPGIVVAFVLDITDRKRAEDGLRLLTEAATMLAATLDYSERLSGLARMSLPLLADWCEVALLEDDGAIRQVVVAALDPHKEELGREQQRRYPLDRGLSHGAPLVLRTGQPEIYQEVDDALLVASARDEQHLALLRAIGLRSFICVPLLARGRILGAITFAWAESNRRYGPADLPLLEDLARRAAVAVDNARLYRQTQDAVQARDAFLSIAAHELKTPLTSLMGYTDLLKRRAERNSDMSERDLKALQVISSQAERLNKMISSLLDLSRIQTGQLSIEQGLVNVGALVSRLVDEVQPTLQQHTLHVQVADQALLVEGDELRLEQVLQNLVQNAIKYSPAGGPITVAAERQGNLVCIAVTDQGMGIPSDSLPQLFNRFYRATNVSSQRISGMGVGLYVVKEIIALHDGTVEVDTREGEGSTFTVCLPLHVSVLVSAAS